MSVSGVRLQASPKFTTKVLLVVEKSDAMNIDHDVHTVNA